MVLHAAISALPTPIDADHAVSVVRAMSTVTGRARVVMTSWHDPIQRRFDYRWMFDPAGTRNHHQHLQHILDALDQAGPALTSVQTELRKAIGVLAEISYHPALGRNAA